MSSVSSFIEAETGKGFFGIEMTVAQWKNVPRLHGPSVSLLMSA